MIDPKLSAAIWQRYDEERPKQGPEFTAWVHRISEECGSSEALVRRVVGEGASAMLNAINDRFQTYAQQIASLMGADLVAALETLRDGLTCTKRRVATNRAGKPYLLDDSKEGPGLTPENMLWIETPDWPSRLSAARSLIEVAGGRAPQQVEVNQKIVSLNLSSHDALAELARLSEAIPRLQSAIAGSGAGDPRPARPRAAIEMPAGAARPDLLDDRMHRNARRPGQGESV